MKGFLVVCLAAVVVSQASGDGFSVNAAKKLIEFSKTLKSEAAYVEAALAPTVERFEHIVGSVVSDGRQRVGSVYNRALQQLDSAPKQCHQGVRQNLVTLRTDADHTFLSCSNLTLAVEDLGHLVTDTGKLLLGLSRSVQELTWFTNCFSWNPIKSLPCFFDWIGLLYQGTKGLISSLSTFNQELDSTLLHMLKVAEYCEKRTTELHDVAAVMEPVHRCANQQVPRTFYDLAPRQ